MSGAATAWPGQEVQQWPGQEAPTAPQGDQRYATVPQEPPKLSQPSPVQSVDEYGRVMPEGQMPSQPVVVGGNAPGYRQSDVLPIARREDVINDPNSRWYEGWALAPGPFKALGQTPAENTTINPETGTLNIAPEAFTTAATLGGVGGLRFGGRAPAFEPPGTLNNLFQQPLSGGFRSNPLGPTLAGRPLPEPGGPISATGISLQNRMMPPEQVSPSAATSPDPAIMTQAEMQARATGHFSPADQAAAANAMLPDANAGAVRKLFSDAVPSDPEQARIVANQPAVQAAKNVDASGPMSFDTAMKIDRDLTSRMRGASGSDAHDLSQLQQRLRAQMDQVPDLESLRQGRQAWMQSIKQGHMEDINYGASLKNDPAAADAYVRQRAAALLKNDSAMRNWTPEETAELEQVARSGDIGMLGRLSVSLIKPVTRMAMGAAGHAVAGPMGAIVGAEIGGDVGATQAARLRAHLSRTTLDPVMQQITRGVPPP